MMGIINSLFEKRSHPSSNHDWQNFFGLRGHVSTSGALVNHSTSLQQSTVFACQRVLSETVGMLPLILYKRLPRGKERAISNSLYSILHDIPNPEMTSMELRETAMGHLAMRGNAYFEIEYSNGGEVKHLWPLRPDKMRVTREGGKLVYVYTMPAGSDVPEVKLSSQKIMHIRGLGYDGIVGYDPISLARESIGLAIATEKFGSAFFSNGAQTGTVYSHPGELGETALNRLQRSIEKRHQGFENSHRIMILEEGMTATQVGISNNNAQFLETRKFSVPEIARFFRMPLHKIQEMDSATFSNIEHQAIEFISDTIQPWLTRFEQAIMRDLLTESERKTYFAEHLLDALLRGDIKTRYESYNIARLGGWMSANDILEKENMNPIKNGDVYLVPMNMTPLQNVANDNEDNNPNNNPDEQRSLNKEVRNFTKFRLRVANSFAKLIKKESERVINREVADVKRAVGKYLVNRNSPLEFSNWLREYYIDHKSVWIENIIPVIRTLADQAGQAVADELGSDDVKNANDLLTFIDEYVTSMSNRETNSSELQLSSVLDSSLIAGEDPVKNLDDLVDSWKDTRPEKISVHESRNALNALSIAFYSVYGITKIVWRTVGDSCPYCRSLDGKVVGINEFFLLKGDELSPEDSERPLRKKSNIRHGPLHSGCDCQTLASR